MFGYDDIYESKKVELDDNHNVEEYKDLPDVDA